MFRKDIFTGEITAPFSRSDYIQQETKNLQKSIEEEEAYKRQVLLRREVLITSGEYTGLTGIITGGAIKDIFIKTKGLTKLYSSKGVLQVRIDSFSDPIWVDLYEDEFQVT